MKSIATLLFSLLLLPAAASADAITTSFSGGAGQIEWTSDNWLGDVISSAIDLTTPDENPQVLGSTPFGGSWSGAAPATDLVSFDFGGDTNPWNSTELQTGLWNGPHDTGGRDYDGGGPDNGGGKKDQVTPVPEPASLLLFGSGAAALAIRRRRQTRNSGTPANA